jgi:EAL domain-containing protein (putative c-di-GMP-specific phosphodiesterase class I)
VSRHDEYISRQGGDEFIILMESARTPHDALNDWRMAAERVREALSAPYSLGGQVRHTSPSIGIVQFCGRVRLAESAQAEAEELLRRADLAMYRAKARGGNAVAFFDPEMQVAAESRARIEDDLRHALAQNAFALHYQMQFDQLEQPVGAEALLRWVGADGKRMSPAEFIPIAEASGLIVPLGHWILRSACEQLAAWQNDPARRHWVMAVNVSARQFMHPGFDDDVHRALQDFGVDPSGFKIEITESLMLENMDQVLGCMTRLKQRGLGFSLDDFGTGYASLSYLQKLPLDQIKIDASFVRRLPEHPHDAAIVRTIIQMGHTLGLKVVAEGVETLAQLDWLKAQGCDMYQGYALAVPVSPVSLADVVQAALRVRLPRATA